MVEVTGLVQFAEDLIAANQNLQGCCHKCRFLTMVHSGRSSDMGISYNKRCLTGIQGKIISL